MVRGCVYGVLCVPVRVSCNTKWIFQYCTLLRLSSEPLSPSLSSRPLPFSPLSLSVLLSLSLSHCLFLSSTAKISQQWEMQDMLAAGAWEYSCFMGPFNPCRRSDSPPFLTPGRSEDGILPTPHISTRLPSYLSLWHLGPSLRRSGSTRKASITPVSRSEPVTLRAHSISLSPLQSSSLLFPFLFPSSPLSPRFSCCCTLFFFTFVFLAHDHSTYILVPGVSCTGPVLMWFTWTRRQILVVLPHLSGAYNFPPGTHRRKRDGVNCRSREDGEYLAFFIDRQFASTSLESISSDWSYLLTLRVSLEEMARPEHSKYTQVRKQDYQMNTCRRRYHIETDTTN